MNADPITREDTEPPTPTERRIYLALRLQRIMWVSGVTGLALLISIIDVATPPRWWLWSFKRVPIWWDGGDPRSGIWIFWMSMACFVVAATALAIWVRLFRSWKEDSE